MSNRKILKAYVRYDATGTLVPGSLVLRDSKPKVNKALQVSDTYECCEPTPSTTTTTSTTATPLSPFCFALFPDDFNPGIPSALFSPTGGTTNGRPTYSAGPGVTMSVATDGTYYYWEYLDSGSPVINISATSYYSTAAEVEAFPWLATWGDLVIISEGPCPTYPSELCVTSEYLPGEAGTYTIDSLLFNGFPSWIGPGGKYIVFQNFNMSGGSGYGWELVNGANFFWGPSYPTPAGVEENPTLVTTWSFNGNFPTDVVVTAGPC